MAARGELWVFGYGSLMWRPDFAFEERVRARIDGFHRAFCIYSTHHRGSPARPGLVLGLDRGEVCEGVAYRIAAGNAAAVVRYLRERELVNGVYREALLPASLHDRSGRQPLALAYVVERAHPSYTGRLPLVTQAHLIRGARGISGINLDYLLSTVSHLAACGIRERSLERLLALCAPHASGRSDAATRAMTRALHKVVARLPDDVQRMRKGDRRRFLYRIRIADRNDAACG